MTVVEYSLITALIALVIVGALNTARGSFNAMLGIISDRLLSAANTSSAVPGDK